MLSVQSISVTRGTATLFDGLSLTVQNGERLALIGNNGCGKSTLLEVLAGGLDVDQGSVHAPQGAQVRLVRQQDDFADAVTVADAFTQGLANQPDHVIAATQDRFALAGTTEISTLSGGWRKRLALAIALADDVDYLLLDEPTNHLDLRTIAELERTLAQAKKTILFVSHDRQFIDRVATRVVELAAFYPGSLLSRPGAYGDFLQARADWLANQEAQAEGMRNKLRREQAWLSRRPKARTTKSQARVDAAGDLASRLADNEQRQRQAKKSATVQVAATGRQANELVMIESIHKAYGDHVVIDDFSLTIAPGDRIVLLGANGSGKTTLLQLLSGKLPADRGKRKEAYGASLQVFDQHRASLDPQIIIRDALCPAGDMVDLPDGSRQHVRAFAESLGFGQERLPQRIGECSGGELARIHLGRLMCTACDVLFLDEPTNDLDLTLRETLEAALAAFTGAVVLVSHDRWFCEQVGDVFLGLDGAGGVQRFTSVAAWEQAQQPSAGREVAISTASTMTNGAAAPASKKTKNPKLARQLRAKVQTAERSVNKCEEELTALQMQWSDPAISGDAEKASALSQHIQSKEDELATAMTAWEEAVEASEELEEG